MLRHRIVVLSIAFGLAILGPAQARQKGDSHNATARQVMTVISVFASREASEAVKAKRPNEATLWQFWAALYEYSASQLPSNWTWRQGLQANIDFCNSMENQYKAIGQKRYANFYILMHNFYVDIWEQLEKGPYVLARFPKEMKGNYPGAPGTPWDPKSLEIVMALSMMKNSGWQTFATPGAGETTCTNCNGIRQWRCTNCYGGGSAGYLKDWTGRDPVSSTGFGSRTGFVAKSCYNCNGTGWVRCMRCNGRGVIPK